MGHKALKQANQPQIQNQRKAAPVLGNSLKYPIISSKAGKVANDGVIGVNYALVCGVGSRLGDVKLLVREFAFFLREHLRASGMGRISTKYPKVLNMVLANLRRAHLEGCGLSIPTGRRSITWNNPESIKYPLRNNVIDYLEAKGLIHVDRGNASKDVESRLPTVCWPQAQLVAWFEVNRIKPILHAKAELLVLRKKAISHYTKKSKKWEVVDNEWVSSEITKRVKVTNNRAIKIPKKDKQTAAQLTHPVSVYNELWLNHTPTLDGRYLLPWARRIFNESLDYGGRFYGSFQQLSKEQRSRILIDGFSTVEPDYSGYHINLLYTWERLQLEVYPYDVEGFDINLIKAVMLPLLNSESLSMLGGQITRSADSKTKGYYERWQREQAVYSHRRATGQRVEKPEKPDYLKGFIEGIPEGTNGKEVIEAIKQKHPLIAHYFGEPKIGVKLQKQDSEIMAAVLCKLAVQGIPALPVHDSLRVKAINELQVVEIMQSEYKRITGFKIDVT